jgi:hypothetical protein
VASTRNLRPLASAAFLSSASDLLALIVLPLPVENELFRLYRLEP